MNRLPVLSLLAAMALTGCSSSASPLFPPEPASAAPSSGTSKPSVGREYVPGEGNQDPTKKIDGVVAKDYPPGQHVAAPTRVAYDHTPPFGGPHDQVWAACEGVVYPEAVRTENLVHSMEHGAVWITYEPGDLDADAVKKLAGKVDGKPFMVMSPFPGQPKPVSVQSWGRQLQVDSADDERIDQFIVATKRNKYLAPEPNATCAALGAPDFDPDRPPPFDPTPPGPDAVDPNAGVDGNQTPVP